MRHPSSSTKECRQVMHYTVDDVGVHVGVSRATVYNWLRAGKIPKPQDVNGHKRWTAEQVNQIIDWRIAEIEKKNRKIPKGIRK